MDDRRNFDMNFDDKLNQILEYNKRQDKLISDIHQVIHGNGNVESGLIVKTARMSEHIKYIIKTMSIHWGLILLMIGVLIKMAFF